VFRRGESLHARLAREAGLSLGESDARSPRTPWENAAIFGHAAIHGIHRARWWDLVVTAKVPGLEGDRARFVALSLDRRLVEEGPSDVAPLALVLEDRLAPPYRAEAVRREGDLWAIAARVIEVVDLPGVAGDEIELAIHGGERTLVIDGRPASGAIPALERPEHIVRARRLHGDTWEVEVNPL
jgi:hypothetical protein